jgi:two-component system, OmpR family, phosphate regulon sensor histidine kinase PhoR
MRLRLQAKGMVLLFSLFLLLLLIQFYLFFSLKTSLFFSSFLALCLMVPATFLLVRSLIKPVLALTQKVMEWVPDSLTQRAHGPPADELGDLSKTITEAVTQLRIRSDEITREKEYHQALLSGMAEGVLLVDEKGRILLVNEALEKLLSISSRVIDKIPLEAVRNVELEEAIQQALQKGIHRVFEITLPPSGGKTFEVNVAGIRAVLNEGAPKIKGAVAVFHDITRLKELEKVRRDFVANVSHELRTPLTMIKGYSETLIEGAWKEDVAYAFIQVIKRHTDRLTKIVEDLLTLSKIESMEVPLKLEKIEVSEFVREMIDFLREASDKKGISIVFDQIPSSVTVEADRSLLEQVFINILDNAIKYTPEGGRIEISSQLKGQEILVAIRDNGIGIPKEDVIRIFERFYRVDKGRSQEMGGTGLGLSIVKHIIQAHGGRVWAESEMGKGSTFFFTIPIPSPKSAL